jgi:hypothetical protein
LLEEAVSDKQKVFAAPVENMDKVVDQELTNLVRDGIKRVLINQYQADPEDQGVTYLG